MIVAQLVRASDCGSEGRGFETHHSPKESTLLKVYFFLLIYSSKSINQYQMLGRNRINQLFQQVFAVELLVAGKVIETVL